MVFEAAARGKPVVALLWPGEADPGLARVCADEDVSRGWLTAARTLQEHTAAIGALLTTPLTNEQRASALAIVRPHGPDLLPGFLPSSQALQEVVDRRAEMPPAPPAPTWAGLLLSPLAALALRRAERCVRRAMATARLACSLLLLRQSRCFCINRCCAFLPSAAIT